MWRATAPSGPGCVGSTGVRCGTFQGDALCARPKVSCARCERIVQASAPRRPIERDLAGPGLLAHVLVAKYADHQPLYRQAEMYAREGVELERSTLADWVGGCSRLLEK